MIARHLACLPLVALLSCKDSSTSSSQAAATPPSAPDRSWIECSIALDPELTHGPLLGAISDRKVKIWIRANRPGQFRVRVRSLEGDDDRSSAAQPLVARDDFTGVVELSGLQPSTRYDYEVALSPPGCDGFEETVAAARLRTLPAAGRPARIRFAVGADVDRVKVPGFDGIRRAKPHFLLMIGDQMYADGNENSFEGFRSEYRRIWGGRQFRALQRVVPTIMTWDDHEIRDNYYRGKGERYPAARKAFEEYQGSHNPDPPQPGVLYFSFVAGEVGFFVLDTRTHRTSRKSPPLKRTILGSTQRAALLRWLHGSKAKVKVIVSSVPFHSAGDPRDSWVAYPREQRQVLSAPARLGVDDVLLITGDRHWSGVFRHEITTGEGDQRRPYALYEFQPTPLGIVNSPAPHRTRTKSLAIDDDHLVYAVVDIDTRVTPWTLVYTLCRAGHPCKPGKEPAPTSPIDVEGKTDNVPYTIELDGDQIGTP